MKTAEIMETKRTRLVSHSWESRFRAVSLSTEAETKNARSFPLSFPLVSSFPPYTRETGNGGTSTRNIGLDRLARSPHRAGMKALQLQQAKQQFCAVAEKAARGKAQIVTKHGKPYVVIVAVEEWRKVQPGRKTVLAALRACPADLTKLDLSRSQEGPRAIHL